MSDKLKIECFLEAIGQYVAARQDGDAEAMRKAAALAERQIVEAVNECVAELVTVEEVARAIAGYEPLMWKHMSELQKQEYLDKAQAVMKLLRKE